MKNFPQIEVTKIADPYARENFKKLQEFLAVEFLFLGFRFFEKEFKGAEPHHRLSHNLGFLPKDVIITSITGAGSATFNQELSTKEELDITATGACIVRFLVGTFNEGK